MARAALSDFVPLDDSSATLAQVPAAVSGVPIAVCSIAGAAERSDDFHPTPRIFVAHSGHGRRWYRRGSRTLSLQTQPRMIELYEQGLDFDHCRWEGEAGVCARLEFDAPSVQALTHGDLPALDLCTRHEVFDRRLSDLSLELANEALAGLPGGRLYAQGLAIAVLGILAHRYAKRAAGASTDAARARGGLSAGDRRRIVELIAGEPGAELSIVRMAAELGLSPYHFARAFKATFETTPHAFVLQQRLQLACAALRRDPGRPIAQIAADCGFASQAHLTSQMQRHLGLTPGQARRQR